MFSTHVLPTFLDVGTHVSCKTTVRGWTTRKDAFQSTAHTSSSVGGKAFDGLYGGATLTRIEWFLRWRVHFGVKSKVGDMQVIPFRPTKWGYDRITMLWRVMVGVTSTCRFKLCRMKGKTAVGYLVVITTRSSTSECEQSLL